MPRWSRDIFAGASVPESKAVAVDESVEHRSERPFESNWMCSGERHANSDSERLFLREVEL